MKRSLQLNARNGFTLFELLVVLALIGLMAAMVVPRFSGSYDKLPLKTATKDVAAILRLARSRAVTRSRNQAVLFYPEKREVVLAQPRADASDPLNQKHYTLSASQPPYQLPDGLDLRVENHAEYAAEKPSGPGDAIELAVFFPIGNSSGATVTVTDAAGRDRRIGVDMITSAVRILEK